MTNSHETTTQCLYTIVKLLHETITRSLFMKAFYELSITRSHSTRGFSNSCLGASKSKKAFHKALSYTKGLHESVPQINLTKITKKVIYMKEHNKRYKNKEEMSTHVENLSLKS